MHVLMSVTIVPLQPNGAEQIYAMDQLSKFEEDKMKEVATSQAS